MLLEEELAREASAKIGSYQKSNYQNVDKKDKGLTSQEVHALDYYTKYIPIGTTHEGQQPHNLHDDILAISNHQREKWAPSHKENS